VQSVYTSNLFYMPHLALGIFLATCGAATLALGMVTQRYALAYPSEIVPMAGLNLPRNGVWFIGLVIYGVANGLYAFSLLFGPLSLLAGVFTTLLIFNMLFAWYFLDETLTPPRVAGAVLILLGVVLCVAGTPNNVDTDFTPRDIASLSRSPLGAMYIATLLLGVLTSVCVITWYEGKYSAAPTSGEPMTQACTAKGQQGGSAQTATQTTGTVAVNGGNIGSSGNEDITKSVPPEWLDRVMGLLYPGSLGVDEGIAHLTMKASVSMLDSCEVAGQCGMGIIYAFVAVWVIASVATLWWLRRVFTRYEATSALPVEYGSVNVVSVCSGLIYYRERRFMSNWQLSLIIVGVAVILSGISVGRLNALPTSYRSVLHIMFPRETCGKKEDECVVPLS
jgi:hypothetical protein